MRNTLRQREGWEPLLPIITRNGQNGIDERNNCSVVEAARTMLEEKSMPKFYWNEAVRIAVYIQNRIGEKVSAHELYFGRKPNLRHLRVFGSIGYVHVPDEKRRKLNPKSKWCVLVGYLHEQMGYKCYNRQTKQVRVSRDVVFEESASSYLPFPPTPNSNPITEDEASEPERNREEEELRDFGTVEENQISIWLS